MNIPDTIINELVTRIARAVAQELGNASSHYTTRVGGVQPPGKSRAWALRNLKNISGAKKIGRDWVISASDFEAWLSERDAVRIAGKEAAPKLALVSHTRDVEELAERSLAEMGMRRVARR